MTPENEPSAYELEREANAATVRFWGADPEPDPTPPRRAWAGAGKDENDYSAETP